MNIQTRFNRNDKVWYQVMGNQYTWGRIGEIRVFVYDIDASCEIVYAIENRFWKEPAKRTDLVVEADFFIQVNECNCFATKQEVTTAIQNKYQKYISDVSEYKPSRWSRLKGKL